MARNVRIASLPRAALAVSDTRDYEACVQEELASWQAQLDIVRFDKPDLIVTPECCDRPAGLPRELRIPYYEHRGERMRDFFREAAIKYNANIAYSAVRSAGDGTFRNSTQFFNRSGGLQGIYDKYLLVIEENTIGKILYAKDISAIQMDFGRVCGSICFDLNFEEPLRKTAAQRPELIVFCSAYHGGLMQQQWAYQCRSYFVSCIGGTETANIINPVGEIIAESSNYHRYLVSQINLDYQVVHLDHNQEKLRAAKEKYGANIEYRTPYGVGCVLLSAVADELTARQVVEEFDIELWDDYYERSMRARYESGRIAP